MNTSKSKKYLRIKSQLEELFKATDHPVSRMATINALLHHKIGYFFWTGFYLMKDGELIVGPYQGPLACLLLKKNTGVCWAGILSGKSIVVPDVHQFPGHIACSSQSNSEIVVPLLNKENQIMGVLDIDSKDYNAFDDEDKFGLEQIVSLVYQ